MKIKPHSQQPRHLCGIEWTVINRFGEGRPCGGTPDQHTLRMIPVEGYDTRTVNSARPVQGKHRSITPH